MIEVRKNIRDKIDELLYGAELTGDQIGSFVKYDLDNLTPDQIDDLVAQGLYGDGGIKVVLPKLRQTFEFGRLVGNTLIDFDQSPPAYVSKRKRKKLTRKYVRRLLDNDADGKVELDEDDLPKIHIIFGQETNEQLTIDTTTRQRTFDITMSVYVNSRLEPVSKPDPDEPEQMVEDVVFGNSDRKLLLNYLEELAFQIDKVMVKKDFGRIDCVTNFDLSTVDYSIDKEIADGQYIVGVLSLNYEVEYVYTYQKD